MIYILKNFPLCPTSNKCYPTNKQGRRFSSKHLTEFQNKAYIWSFQNNRNLNRIKRDFDPKKWLEIDMYIHLPEKKIFDKMGRVKSWDASNRIKATHDSIADLLDIDDRHFAVGKSVKIISSKEYVTLVLRYIDMQTDKQINSELKVWESDNQSIIETT